MEIIVYDYETFKYDWMMCYLDTDTREVKSVINNREELKKVYEKYKDQVWVGYNSAGYDQYILKGILCGFDPYEINNFIIKKGRKGFEFSKQLNKYPLYNYDCIILNTSLKECEAYMGHSIVESKIPWDIDRPLTQQELLEVEKYCKHDVMETFAVFIHTMDDYNSQIDILKEFKYDRSYVSKTKAQLASSVLEATRRKYDDEFEIDFVDTLQLGKYEFVKKWYEDWAKLDLPKKQKYAMSLKVDIEGVPHVFGFGGIHGARPKYHGEGRFILPDVSSYYPSIILRYDFLSRNVSSLSKYERILEMRLLLKANNNSKEKVYKLIGNSTFGASKDQYNTLYDPRMANNICINGQLLLLDLIEKVGDFAMLIASNTDGIMFKLYKDDDYDQLVEICEEWSKRTGMKLDYDEYVKVFQKDVNNYIAIEKSGKYKAKGAYVKNLKPIDNNLPIVNKALRNYFVYGKPLEETIMESNDLIDFQIVKKIGGMYEYVFKENSKGTYHQYTKVAYKTRSKNKVKYKERCVVDESKYGKILHTRVNRIFASKLPEHGGVYKKKKDKDYLDKLPGTPDRAFILNTDINGKTVPSYVDRQWYIELAKERVKQFIGR